MHHIKKRVGVENTGETRMEIEKDDVVSGGEGRETRRRWRGGGRRGFNSDAGVVEVGVQGLQCVCVPWIKADFHWCHL